ncbi:alanyl-tRNA editing protein [Anaerotignum lactatifermentans]|uniref:Alanyl-tRNA editing protein n=1 Tax=Anaerotignum lactatifermentans TaxID=160404 RepID=A0ABS2GD81_9FIRM|nr:alanine--tRNA ligase-related protein [Anaerotignum lactatifermentans]MBM6828659.1 alanyl-tRNA editing protein [Anaerotignum lactatifermentans]MBM6878577.1 alanyl-tRNA editing protein [Anaerotignum lactatifermentans]MBM6950241.1 alanyl-tRNA editing protein [Anaerotignum lactatifermentans]
METKKRYYENAYEQEFTSKVLDCREKGKDWAVILEETAFYPEGGGQPADTGYLNDVRVKDVREKDGEILHITEEPLEIGTVVTGKIDWNHRFDLMQNHSGEHILSGVICGKYHCENVGFHMGKDAVLIDFNAKIPPEDLPGLEEKANEAIWRNTQVLSYYPTPEELDALEYRSKKALSGQVRILEVPGYDRCACCGTHVAYAGAVGQVKILSAQNYKGGTRLEIVSGMRALADYQLKNRNAAQISELLSVPPNGIAKAVASLKEERDALRQTLHKMKWGMLHRMAEDIGMDEKQAFFLRDMEAKDLVHFADIVLEKTGGTAAVFSNAGTGYAFVLMSRKEDMRQLAAELREAVGGKGGGKPESVQGRTEAKPAQWKKFLEEKGFSFREAE